MKMKAGACIMPFLDSELYRLHHIIKTKSSGTPHDLAKRLNCSVSTIYSKIKTLREAGLPVEYCPIRCCYYYDGDVSIDFAVRINGEEAQKIVGGNTINKMEDFLSLQNNWSGMWEF